jgi:hypothetical protein
MPCPAKDIRLLKRLALLPVIKVVVVAGARPVRVPTFREVTSCQ